MIDFVKNKLSQPFPADEIEWRVGSTNKEKTKGIALAYLTNRAIQNRLDEVLGIYGWKNEFREWKDGKQLCGISIRNGDEWITKWDGADDTDIEGTKGGLSDAMKRCACQWGIGRYLYNLPTQWCDIEPCGRSYKLKNVPKLPAWALPMEGNAPDDEKYYLGVAKTQTVNELNKYYLNNKNKVSDIKQFESLCKSRKAVLTGAVV